MNPSLRTVLLELAFHGYNPDIQTGIRLAFEFLEAAGDTSSALDDLHLILEVLEAEPGSGNSLPEQLYEISLEGNPEGITPASFISRLCSDLAEETRAPEEEQEVDYRIERAVL